MPINDKNLPVLDSTQLRINARGALEDKRPKRKAKMTKRVTKAGIIEESGVVVKRSVRDDRRPDSLPKKGKSNG